jgi:ribosome biogenesis GTPase A
MDEFDEAKLVLFSAKSPNQVKDAEFCAEYLIDYLKQNFPEKLKKMGISNLQKAADKMLEEIALRKNKLRKGGVADTNAAAKIILLQWQKGTL